MTEFNTDVTDLILLVGTNPLPALVTAKYFIKNNYNLNKIWFVYSNETKIYKDNLIEAIGKISSEEIKSPKFKVNDKTSFENVEVEERNAKNILEKMGSISSENKKSFFHLNYTCGTKSMVVHSYRALEEKLKDKISFSYLDPESFTIKDDDGTETKDLRDEINVNFEEMVLLHKYSKTESDNFDFKSTKDNVIKVFEEFINEGNIFDTFYSKNSDQDGRYNRKIFENKKGDLTDKLKDIKENISRTSNFSLNDSFKKVLSAFGEYNIFDENWKIKSEIAESKDEEKAIVKFFIKFLDGVWLEYYVYKIMNEIKEELNREKDELTLSSEVYKDDDKNNDLEIDLTYVKGYQLFGISCTTSPEKYTAKSKGFEVIQRTKQLGGDESKAILITTMKDEKAKDLEKSLSIHTGNKQKPFMVLGLEDLKPEQLKKEIKKFIFNIEE